MGDTETDLFNQKASDELEARLADIQKGIEAKLLAFDANVKQGLELQFEAIADMLGGADEALVGRINESIETVERSMDDYRNKVQSTIDNLAVPTPPAASVAVQSAPPSTPEPVSGPRPKGLLSVAVCAVLCMLMLMGTGWMVTYQVKENNRLHERNAKLLKDARTLEKAIVIMKEAQNQTDPSQ